MSFIPIFIPVQQFPFYIKKKELEEYILKQKKQVRFNQFMLFASLLIVHILMYALVLPQLMQTFDELNAQFPSHSVPLIVFSLIAGFVCLTISLRLPPLNEELITKLRQDEDEMVSIHSRLINPKITLIMVLYTAMAFFALLIALILPIFTLPSSI